MVKALPNTSFLPVSKSAPAGHATAAAHLLWQVFPRYPCLEYKDNSGQSCPVRYTWTASFGRGLMFWQKRFNLTPQFVAYQFPGHLLHPHWYFTAYSSICQVLLGALNQSRETLPGICHACQGILEKSPPQAAERGAAGLRQRPLRAGPAAGGHAVPSRKTKTAPSRESGFCGCGQRSAPPFRGAASAPRWPRRGGPWPCPAWRGRSGGRGRSATRARRRRRASCGRGGRGRRCRRARP